MAKRRGLGMGLGALIQGADSVNVVSSERPRKYDTSNLTESIRDDVKEKIAVVATGADAVSKSATNVVNAVKTSTKSASGRNSAAKLKAQGADILFGVKPALGEREVIEELVPTPGASFKLLPIDSVIPNRDQPRAVFDDDELKELSASIVEFGVLQPIRVREVVENGLATGEYELIMGERRLRASKLAKMATIPAIIADVKDDELLTEALVENIQRVNLNPLETASAYRQLMDDFNLTQDELSKKIGISRPKIANTLRLLKLPLNIQRRVASGVLSEGHARAILGLPTEKQREKLAVRIVAEGLSVRSTEEEVAVISGRMNADEKSNPTRKSSKMGHSIYIPEVVKEIEESLNDILDTSVSIKKSATKGQIVVNFADLTDLKRIYRAICTKNSA
ncbi:MAG: ParB/RepB/Spo0J family partition protein [Candidatus Ancillula sp.]|jgi:ParB family chromosome partitioning protein|nr:ParB/RepB/Spo0J family partition protein [Candidatus Ancillula sp.]